MGRLNAPLLSFNRGIVSSKALARVDLDRTKLSAEVMTNWLPRSQGSMAIRPGTKWLGSSFGDTGAAWIEFVAATDDVALVEMTANLLRVWIPSDTGRTWETPAYRGGFVPLSRPLVTTDVSLSDTGWENASTGGTDTGTSTSSGSTTSGTLVPTMGGNTSGTISIYSSNSNDGGALTNPGGNNDVAWAAFDDNSNSFWQDTGTSPSWIKVDFGSGKSANVDSYSLQAGYGGVQFSMPHAWQIYSSNYDTGSYANDFSKWHLSDSGGNADGSFGANQTKTFNVNDAADTGNAGRYWGYYIPFSLNHGSVTNIDYFGTISTAGGGVITGGQGQQVTASGSGYILNAQSVGGLARIKKRVVIGTPGVEHALNFFVQRGPVTFRVGSSDLDDDYVRETTLGTGFHSLAFIPFGDYFYITLQTSENVDRLIASMEISDSGTMELPTSIGFGDLDSIRYDQSADVVFVDCLDVPPSKLERRGTGRSWSWVYFEPRNGPFLSASSSTAKIAPSGQYGNITLDADVPFFTVDHVGALMRIFHEGQSGIWALGDSGAKTDNVEVTGLSDTGTPGTSNERRITFTVTGGYAGQITIERSYDDPEFGFHTVSADFVTSGSAQDTGTFTTVIDDEDDNINVWYRARLSTWNSGAAHVQITYTGGGVTGIARIVAYGNNQSVNAEVYQRFSNTIASENWQEGSFSAAQAYPTSVALHGGRLCHAGGSSLYLSVSDDYENFSDDLTTDAGPIVRTLGSGPVDKVYYMLSLLRLVVGTSGAEISIRASSLDEPLTPTATNAQAFSTQGSANMRAVKMDSRAIFVQRSEKRVFMISFASNTFTDYEVTELTMLVPDLLEDGIVDIAVQRQPDTRIHCVLSDGRVAILTHEPQEQVLCWSMWETNGRVLKASVLPGRDEDGVFYHVERTISGVTKRYLERWAADAEGRGDTGLTFLADCAKSYTDTGRALVLTGFQHLSGMNTVVFGDDTGPNYPGRSYSDSGGDSPKTYLVDAGTGNVTLTTSVHHAVVGLDYTADWRSTKLAYAAEAGTALAQMKRTDKIAFVLHNTYQNGLYFGADTGRMDALPRVDQGKVVDTRTVYIEHDRAAMPFPGLWDSDSRINLRGKATRPVTVMAAVPTVQTNEKV